MRQKTISIKKSETSKKWVLIDADNIPLGRLATNVAGILRGKNKIQFTPHLDTGDNVVVINAAKIKLTGNKEKDKTYYRHSGRVGHLKSETLSELMEKSPEEVIKRAVHGMLPKNRLGKQLIKNLRIFADNEHTLKSQKPELIKI